MNSVGVATGKIILSGEYAVVFGYPAIAIPAEIGMRAVRSKEVVWEKAPTEWFSSLCHIIALCQEHGSIASGVTIENQLPLGCGMGASTSLVIAVTRCLFQDSPLPHIKKIASSIEDTLNPGHSGLDFEVIWTEKPILFQKGSPPKSINISLNQFIDTSHHFCLIDTGNPGETTPELVSWVRSRMSDPAISAALQTIGHCTERLLKGEDITDVFKVHHRAQMILGVVPQKIQNFIADIEESGGAAKVIGAGSTSGGGGVVLAIAQNTIKIVSSYDFRHLHSQHRLHEVLGKS
ncbi:hypothetical protein A3D11_03085 [Candidatus Peribacteria bacterium RIFCSPHIGHO2_02_FULL_49_16]|nr:MAG: hypothetical protein A2880_01475 [Candidatus Peribacteria bacterium RIFCSPHIGHO2_01_FULL_49_38]OGJ58567.1 MAG: hypothetical protein A3D11_03085 [Candidatus Peribacteria bacterium RIFCSPHIGHO2_02_FULL_49_16]